MFQKIITLPQNDGLNELLLPEVTRLQVTNSRYPSKGIYSNMIMAKTEEMFYKWGIRLSDEINSDNEYYNYFYNIQRDRYGLPRIELKVGETYILKLGKKNIKQKEMVLVKINNLAQGKFPELYFTEVYNWGGTEVSSIKSLVNISYGKILKTKKIQCDIIP